MEIKCKECNSRLNVKQGKLTSEVNTTDVMLEQKYSCSNTECKKFDEVIETTYVKVSE